MIAKALYLLLISSALLSFANAQESWTFSIASGRSFPVGKFGGKNLNDSTNSFARPGPAAKISAAYNFTSMFSLMLAFGLQENKVDVHSIGTQLEQKLPNTTIAIESHNWWIWKMMAGPNLNIPLDKVSKCILSVHVLGGMLKTGVPQFKMSTATSDSSGSYAGYSETSKQSLNWTFMYDIGAGYSFRFTKHFAVFADVDYSGAHVRFFRSYSGFTQTGVITGTGNGPVNIPTPAAIPKQSIASVNFQLGVAFSL